MLVIFSGPSGVGKNSVISGLIKRYPDRYRLMPTVTTRAMRPGERDGMPYYFWTEKEFLEGLQRGEFVEHQRIHGNLYGINKRVLETMKKENEVLLKDIDVLGTMNILGGMQGVELMTVFVTVSGKAELEDRLRKRGETEDAIALRLSRFGLEMEYKKHYDFVVFNDVLDKAVDEVHRIIGG